MNVDDGSLRQLLEGENPKPNEVEVNIPHPDCPRCKGKGSILFDIFKDMGLNRAERRHRKNDSQRYKYIPCPECNPD